MSTSTDLVTAKKNLAGALGDNMKLYLQLLKSWFKQKTTREDFDHEARKLLTMDSVHLHNQFMLAILAKCQSLGSPASKSSADPMTSTTLTNSPTKPKKLKPKKRSFSTSSSPKVSFNQRFVPVNALVTAPQIPTSAPEPEERSPGFVSRELAMPDAGLVHCRLLVTAWEHGLEEIDDEAAVLLMKAIQVQLKNVLSAVFSKRSGYKVREKRFKYAFGTEVAKHSTHNSLFTDDYSTETEATAVNMRGHHTPAMKPSPEAGLQQAAIETAATGGYPPPSKGKVTLHDLYSALKVCKSAIPSHSVYATNMERIVQRMWHPTNEDLEQEETYRNDVKHKQDMQTRQHLSAISLKT